MFDAVPPCCTLSTNVFCGEGESLWDPAACSCTFIASNVLSRLASLSVHLPPRRSGSWLCRPSVTASSRFLRVCVSPRVVSRLIGTTKSMPECWTMSLPIHDIAHCATETFDSEDDRTGSIDLPASARRSSPQLISFRATLVLKMFDVDERLQSWFPSLNRMH